MKEHTRIRLILLAILFLLGAAALCGYFYFRDYSAAQVEITEYAAVQAEYTTIVRDDFWDHRPVTSVEDADVTPATPASSGILELRYVAADFAALSSVNPDIVGWIAIPDTNISYPVVQADDNRKYLDVSFKGGRSDAGTPFADSNNNLRSLDANTIIYGHNMGAGRTDMFGELLSYKDRAFFDAHRYIQFDTVYERHGWWKVVAVIEYDIRSKDFDYLYLWFDDDTAFMEWVSSAVERSLHASDVEISPNDRILTLSTCDRSKYGRNGRLLVTAVKLGREIYLND